MENRADRDIGYSARPRETDTQPSSLSQAIQLALQHHKAGNLPQAEQLYQEVLSVDPDHVDANHLLGVIAHQVGNNELSVHLIQKAVQANPAFAEAHCHLGNACKALGRWEQAIVSYQQALAIKPDIAEAHNNLGLVFEKTGRWDEAATCYHRALSLAPNTAETHNNLGIMYQKTGRMEEAIKSYKQALMLNPNYAGALNNLGIVFQKTGCPQDAIDCFQKAITIQPDFVEAHNHLGNVLREVGRMDEAVACFRQTLAIKPNFAQAHWNLAFAVKHTEYDDDISAMETLYRRQDLSDDQRMYLGFGLGKAFEDLQDYERAFDYMVAANRLKRTSYDYAVSEDQAFFGRIKKTFTSTFFADRRDYGCPNETPIFILGMPRSGTTLVEQILASHSQVYGAGELNDLATLTQTLDPSKIPGQYPRCVPGLDRHSFQKTGLDYICRVRRYSPDAAYITDKMPYNFFHVGLIKAILPNAKVVHCMRDPMDNCLSLFKTYFSAIGSHKYAYDLKELAQYYTLYLGLMEHWRNALPGFMLEIHYEELVSHQEDQTRQLLAFCGLPWEDECLSFYTHKRPVATASAAQVRRPMYTDSVRRWKYYQTQLEPLWNIIQA